MADTQDQSMENRALLYEFTRREFDREDARWESADRKATGLTPILGLMLGVAGFFGNWLLQAKMLPPGSYLEWFTLVCVASAFAFILAAWVFVLNAFRVRRFSTSGLRGDALVEFFLERDIKTLHTGCAYRFARDAEENKRTVDRKNRWLIRSYYSILVAASLLVLLLVLMGLHGWWANA